MNQQLDLEIEQPAAELEIEPSTVLEVTSAAQVDVLPANSPLPRWVRFVPNIALKNALDAAVVRAKAIVVVGEAGIAAADAALVEVRDRIAKAMDEFKEPAEESNKLHKDITGTRSDWIKTPNEVVSSIGQSMIAEQRRLDAIAAEAARVEQEAANKLAREAASKEVTAATEAKAPAEVVEQLQQKASTVQAAPVSRASYAPAKPANSSIVKSFKARLKGTPAEQEPNPDTAEVTPLQLAQVKVLLRAIIDGTAPVAAIQLDWSYLNRRAGADKLTLDIPGIEVYEDSGLRAKRGKRV